MKISSHEVRAALKEYARMKNARPVPAPAPDPAGVRCLKHRMADLPDQRDTLVHDLRRKIRRGRYYVSSRDIVSALLGRLAADLLP